MLGGELYLGTSRWGMGKFGPESADQTNSNPSVGTSTSSSSVGTSGLQARFSDPHPQTPPTPFPLPGSPSQPGVTDGAHCRHINNAAPRDEELLLGSEPGANGAHRMRRKLRLRPLQPGGRKRGRSVRTREQREESKRLSRSVRSSTKLAPEAPC